MTTTPESKHTVRALRDLPQAIAPPRDLWPGIVSQLPDAHRSWFVPMSIAASVVMIALGVVIGTRVPAGLVVDSGYKRQREELLLALPGKLERLPPESRQHVLDSLQGIQTALRDIEAELGRESGSAMLQELLISASQEEMRVLTTVSEADGWNQEI